MEWITTANGLVALITALVGLIGTGIGAYFSIKAFIKANKEKNGKEIWALIMSIADAAMKDAEASQKQGVEKKEMVVSAVRAGCKQAGINIDDFLVQLEDYIDQSIKFFNDMKNKAEGK